jgi:hypothetical protein
MFNRPDHAARVISAVARAKPKRLFLSVDGPRRDVATDRAGVAGCRALISMIDWDCEVKTRFREENLGCREGMIDGVSWFFEHVEDGVVLEDDCVPAEGMLRFSGQALAAYCGNRSVMQISGFGHVNRFLNRAYFIPLSSSWGWATWRDRWEEYLATHEEIAVKILADPRMCESFDLGGSYRYSRMLRRSMQGEISSWAVFFQAFVFWKNGLVLYPPASLIRNIGFDGSGTHCGDREAGEEGTGSAKSVRIRFPRRVRCSQWMLGKVKDRIRRR